MNTYPSYNQPPTRYDRLIIVRPRRAISRSLTTVSWVAGTVASIAYFWATVLRVLAIANEFGAALVSLNTELTAQEIQTSQSQALWATVIASTAIGLTVVGLLTIFIANARRNELGAPRAGEFTAAFAFAMANACAAALALCVLVLFYC